MSALFRARAEDLHEKSCKIRLYIIHPDQDRFYASRPFALQLLWDAARVNPDQLCPLVEQIDTDKINDPEYLRKNSTRYIASVRYVERKNYPRLIQLEHMSDADLANYWANEEGLPQAVILIKVTDPRWLAHLVPGMEWETAAYDP